MDVRNDLNPLIDLRSAVAVEAAKQIGPSSDNGALTLPADSANVSQAAALAERAMQLPDVREEKVAAVQKSIADGSYHVEAADVAAAILGEDSAPMSNQSS